MISQREIERRYNDLIKDVESKEFYTSIDLTNRVNCYICDDGHVTKTRDIDRGVTPMFHKCGLCRLSARSSFYKDIRPSMNPTQEWFRPTLKQVLKMRKNEGMLEHILSGGLDVRIIEK